ncbi:hypothetical protein tinsulaeT_23360 [Thalassotalea insulae]|uniref:DUF3592 domain-containing protein n=1 Tax=Thalassotalea insulae TaxID=2056778 RepID=A0ABQ6GXS6_9GAMM|nr:DUF3592 domain-containing protein [Thalassotalea insulae]GLX78996.1 hypothetical protein tinsulaeT_23360 [Thalassotalea insulae]
MTDELLMLGIKVYVLAMTSISLFFQWRMSQWQPVWGELAELKNTQLSYDNSAAEQSWMLTALYRYQVGGEVYYGSRVSAWEMTGSGALRNIPGFLTRYIEQGRGEQVRVYHHPTKPKKSMLIIPGWRSYLLTTIFGGGIFLLFHFAQ